MVKTIRYGEKNIPYDLQYKNVKNINLRVKRDGTVHVSASRRVPQKVLDAFLLSKAAFILDALEKYKNKAVSPRQQYVEEDAICDYIRALCKKVYPYYEKWGLGYPEIRFRKMVSRWGSCQPEKRILTFNMYLMYAPPACIEYVVLHEFTHFLQGNHSKQFYAELEKVCPDWKAHRKRLKEISIREEAREQNEKMQNNRDENGAV